MQEITSGSKEATGSCRACGLSPVNHTLAYVLQSFDVFMNDRAMRARTSRSVRIFHKMMERPVEIALPLFLGILTSARVLQVSRDPARTPSYRSQVIWEEAQRRGIVMEQYVFFGAPLELYRARIGDRWIYFESIPVPPVLERDTFKGIDDKILFKEFLLAHDIPVADAGCATNLGDARAIFERLHKPIIVKPRIGSRARHTTTHITLPTDFDAAFHRAQQLCRSVVIEEHLHGGVCRATVVNGVLTGFLQMLPARVTGDGIHTIRELVAIKNEKRHPRVAAVELDGEHAEYIGRLGLSFDSVLEKERAIDLSRRTGRFEGGETRELPREVHPKLRGYIERAAQALQAPVIGFDVIIPDPTIDPDTQRWGILEGNGVPFIDLHYLPLYGEPTNVAAAVWDLWGA